MDVSLAAGVLADRATGNTMPEAVPPQVIRKALACTAVPVWLRQATPIEVLHDASGPPAFFYPYTHTIYVGASSYLREGDDWDVSRIAMLLGHEFGHAFQRIAAPSGSPAWKEFERLTPGFEDVPLGMRTYQAWQKSRAEAFAEAYRLLFGGIGAQFPPLVRLSVTPAIRAYFQELNTSALDVSLNHLFQPLDLVAGVIQGDQEGRVGKSADRRQERGDAAGQCRSAPAPAYAWQRPGFEP